VTKVLVLPDALANQIAAGEVVERPASVVKELVENAIDAGATRVVIGIESAGRALVRVVDDGEGMSREDAELAVLRHATSKIRTADDLMAIGTLGFRGEALPSIASVSRFVLLTRRAEDDVATKVSIEGGARPVLTPAASPVGTIIEVRDLFWNVPARLKFLKSDGTEAGHVSQLVTSFALGHPHIHFQLTTDDKLALDFPIAKRLFDRATQALGKAAQRELFEVDFDGGPIRVTGFVSAPQFARSTPNHLATFVNGRRVRDRTLQHAVIQAYGAQLGHGRFPQAILYVHLDPHAVDVNVHPTKAEVRFQNPSLVHESMMRAVQATLLRRPWQADATLPLERLAQPTRVMEPRALEPTPHPPSPPGRTTELRFGPPVVYGAPLSVPLPLPPSEPSAASTALRVIGTLSSGLVVVESEGALLVLDALVAERERLLAELLRAHTKGAIATQPLLMPAALELDRRASKPLTTRAADLGHLGLWVEPFGGNTFQVMGLPTPIAKAPPGRVLEAVAALLTTQPKADDTALLRVMAKAAAAPNVTPTALTSAAIVARLQASELRRE